MKEKIDALKEVFMLMPEWADRYNYLIELGEQLPDMLEAFRIPENRISCNSMLYFHVSHVDGVCRVFAMANTAIPAGLAGLLFLICDGIHREELLDTIPYLVETIDQIGLVDHLTPTRREALLTMITRLAI